MRCIFEMAGMADPHPYEERVTLWNAESFEEATDWAEEEAKEYAGDDGDRYLGVAQSFVLAGEPTHGAEVSLSCVTVISVQTHT